ncbi:MAG: FAD-binding oxidoreductase [Gammaproteobacteria bacterium]|nr:FAD-binding oxidoreductase [Gammaproteobacteria bacterium]MBL6999353.1 FAD-binding oxidoreductase [Gammaproteobacteria bacterium]
MNTNVAQLKTALAQFIGEDRLIDDPLRTLAYGTDASFYRLIPQLVVKLVNEDEVSRLLRLAKKFATPVTFRASGTSLSGQAITDSVLAVLEPNAWRDYKVLHQGRAIRLQPGVIGARANEYLLPLGRKIGPDPASINAARIGGIAANNASGMCCGTAQNSYQTLLSMRVILADGSVLDTASEASRGAFRLSHQSLLQQLGKLAQDCRDNQALAARIRHKFSIKNTTGYSLNALVDFRDPIDILQQLMIGSEGTLGFIAEITYKTVAEHAHKASALVFFGNIQMACEAVAILKQQPVAAVELMDRAALRSVENKPGMTELLKDLPEQAAALLIETRASDNTALAQQIDLIEQSLHKVESLFPVSFSDVVEQYSRLWNIRKGLFPTVGAMRETGTTVIIEDVAFAVPKLAAATLDLQQLLKQHGYHEAIIFGHALEGNLHFVFTQDFSTTAEVERYHDFMHAVCELVVHKYDGSLKGEHSTGRNMAPYVELEWGTEAYRLMQQIKALFDPDLLLNPGVILNDDPRCHVTHLKALPAVDPLVDKCIECGFCEPACPSRALTLTPRQRIAGLREIARLGSVADSPSADVLRAAYQYQGIQTCAGCGLCSLSCPVGIDTGSMIRALRTQQHGSRAHKVADFVADNFDTVCSSTRVGLAAANLYHSVLGTSLMQRVSSGARKLSGQRIPLWNASMPTMVRYPKLKPVAESEKPRVVYFPSCVSRTMGPAKGDSEHDSLPHKTEQLLRKAGFEVVYPEQGDALCCGMPFESKGLPEQAGRKLREIEQRLYTASRDGRDPVVFDTSPCSHRLKQQLQTSIKLYDITEFIHDVLLERLHIEKQAGTIALHATCSTRKMGLQDKLLKIAEACAEHVIVPDEVTCCGWAGDKGFSVPELNASALLKLKPALADNCTAGYSTSRSCEIGLSLHSGLYYRSIVYLVEQCATQSPKLTP